MMRKQEVKLAVGDIVYLLDEAVIPSLGFAVVREIRPRSAVAELMKSLELRYRLAGTPGTPGRDDLVAGDVTGLKVSLAPDGSVCYPKATKLAAVWRSNTRWRKWDSSPTPRNHSGEGE